MDIALHPVSDSRNVARSSNVFDERVRTAMPTSTISVTRAGPVSGITVNVTEAMSDSASNSTSQQPARQLDTSPLSGLPVLPLVTRIVGLLALGSGLLYGVGLAIRYAQLADQGLSPTQAANYFDLQDVLMLGAVKVLPVFVLLAAFLAIRLVREMSPISDRERNRAQLRLAARRWSWRDTAISAGIAVMIGFFLKSPTFAAALFCLIIISDAHLRLPWLVPSVAWIAGGLFVLVVFAVETRVDPDPLPKVQISLTDPETSVSGSLVSHRDGFWHVLERPGEVVSYPDSRVASAVATQL